MPDSHISDTPRILSDALSRLLKPLVRMLIHYQLTFPYVSQLLKSVYLQVAEESFPVEGKRVTDSRLSLLTGVHRKDVRRLRYEEAPVAANHSRHISLSAQVIATWLSLPEYSNNKGEAKPLYKLSANGEPSFESLVEQVSKQDLHSRSLLDEWLRKNIVSIDKTGLIHLEKDAFLPGDNFEEKVFFFGRNLHDHFAASTSNLISDKPAFFDRAVYYNNLTPESIQELKTLSEQEAMKTIKLINRKARQLQRKDNQKPTAGNRFRLGAYFYTEKQSDDTQKSGKADE